VCVCGVSVYFFGHFKVAIDLYLEKGLVDRVHRLVVASSRQNFSVCMRELNSSACVIAILSFTFLFVVLR